MKLLDSCPRLTHLSLTGVQAFLRHDLEQFCRDAPNGKCSCQVLSDLLDARVADLMLLQISPSTNDKCFVCFQAAASSNFGNSSTQTSSLLTCARIRRQDTRGTRKTTLVWLMRVAPWALTVKARPMPVLTSKREM